MDLKIYPHMRKRFEELAHEANEFADMLLKAKNDMGEEEHDQYFVAVDRMAKMLMGVNVDRLKQYEN